MNKYYNDNLDSSNNLDNENLTYESLIKNWEFKGEYKDQFCIKFSFNSGKIENKKFNYHDTREIFEKGSVSSYTGDVITLIEQVNQKNCMNLVFNKDLVLSKDLIKKFHFTLMNGCMADKLVAKGEQAGEFKKGDYVVGRNDVGCLPDEVEEELEFIINEFNDAIGNKSLALIQVLKIATYFHAWFECIHPFSDGNGRTGRMLLNWMLIKLNHPPIVVFNEDKIFYYEALENFNETEDLSKLFEFFKYQAVKTWSFTFRMKSGKRASKLLDSDLFK